MFELSTLSIHTTRSLIHNLGSKGLNASLAKCLGENAWKEKSDPITCRLFYAMRFTMNLTLHPALCVDSGTIFISEIYLLICLCSLFIDSGAF